MSAIETQYKVKDYCFQEINNIRAVLGDKTKLSDKAFDNALKSLLFMRLYAPKEILGIVDAQISEVEKRQLYYLTSKI